MESMSCFIFITQQIGLNGLYNLYTIWHPSILKPLIHIRKKKAFNPPVMLILADHLEVPSSTLCLICFICVPCVVLSRPNTSWICSKISGLFLSLIFMRSFRTMMMFWVRSSAPCLELFSAAPDEAQEWREGCRRNSLECEIYSRQYGPQASSLQYLLFPLQYIFLKLRAKLRYHQINSESL